MLSIISITIRLLNNRFNINNRKSALIGTLFAFVELQYIEIKTNKLFFATKNAKKDLA